MRLLFDDNISWRIKRLIKEHFEESLHVSDIKRTLMTDSEIWQYAKMNNYIIVTFDEDFYNIQMIDDFPPKIIWLRLGNTNTHSLAQRLISLKDKIFNFNQDNEQGGLEVY